MGYQSLTFIDRMDRSYRARTRQYFARSPCPFGGGFFFKGIVMSGTPADIDDICAQFAGGKSLRSIARELGKAASAIRYWLSIVRPTRKRAGKA